MMRIKIHNSRRKESRGAILIMIIGIIFLLGFIVTEYLGLVTDEIRRKNDTTGNYFLKIESYNALELTLAYLSSIQEVDKGLFNPKQAWDALPLDVVRDPEASDTLQTTVTLVDETGKISLRKPNKDLLITLFKEMKFDDGIAQELAESLIDWISTKEQNNPFNTFGDYYKDQKPPYFAASLALISYDELFYLKNFRVQFFNDEGNPNEAFFTFKEITSLYNDEGINLNTAPPLVIETLSRLTDVPKAEFTSRIWGPDEKPGTKDDIILRDAAPLKKLIGKKYDSLIQVNPSYLKINIATHFGERLHTINVLMHIKNQKKEEEQTGTEGNPNSPPAQKEKSTGGEMQLLLMQENHPLD